MRKRTDHSREGHKKKKMRSLLSDFVLIIAIVVFCYSAYNLWEIYSEYKKGSDEYEAIQELVTTKKEPEVSENKENPEDVQMVQFRVDFSTLKEMNADVVAWIRFEEPSVSCYPVVLGIDNDKYLSTTFEGKKNAAGTLFIDMVNSADFSDRNTFIYGHNMKNGSMFGRLREYKSAEFCQKHPYFYIYTPDGKESVYQIYSAAIVKDTSETYAKVFSGDEAFVEYLQYIKDLSLYDTGVEADAGSQLVSLSTCTNVRDDERLVVHGVKISEKMVEE